MFTVGLKNFEIWTYIGLYEEEQKVPNKLTFNGDNTFTVTIK